jgi:gamma-glutamylcyclotransferase (GGCT)/AIG2-like uncharacterized protein YtfP
VAESLREHFHLFAYGTLRRDGASASMLRDCEFIGAGTVNGVLYNIDNQFPALVLYGNAPVSGDVWRCPAAMLPTLDAYERIEEGLFRRIGVNVEVGEGEIASWVYVAGSGLSRKLSANHRIASWPAGVKTT